MRIKRIHVLAWTARLLGWAGVLLTLLYVALNYNGITLRGHFARLIIPDERDAALGALLDRYGLYRLSGFRLDHWQSLRLPQHRLEWVLLRRPRSLILRDGDDWSLAVVVLDPDGTVVGTPVVFTPDAEYQLPTRSQVVSHFDATYFLVVSQRGPATPPALRATRQTVYRLTQRGPVRVFSIQCRGQPTMGVYCEGVSDDSARLRVVGWPVAGGSPVALAQFAWNEALETFVGPADDPQDRWRVTFPAPYPGRPGEAVMEASDEAKSAP